jgi:hypothetical protein
MNYKEAADTPEGLLNVIQEEAKEGFTQKFSPFVLKGLTEFAVCYDFKEVDRQTHEERNLTDADLEKELRAMVASKLKMAGISVPSLDQWRKTPTRPILLVAVRITYPEREPREESHSKYGPQRPHYDKRYYIAVAGLLYDQISIVRKPNITFYAPVWRHAASEYTESNLAEQFAKEVIETFCDDYIAANPKTEQKQ